MKPNATISFGSQEIELNVAPQAAVPRPQVAAIQDIKAAVKQALASPAGYPCLADAILPGDRVVIAVDWGVPQLQAILAGVFETLEAAGSRPADVCVVLADERDERESLLSKAADAWQSVPVTWHDPVDRDALGYLAANEQGEPIYFCRAILDADFVIPVAVKRADFSLGEFGIYSGLFPAFTDANTACRFNSSNALSPEGREKFRKEADQAGWLLGSRFTVQIIPGAAGEITKILAGEVDAVAGESQRFVSSTWNATVDEPAQLVVACVGGDASQQNWRNVARALEAAVQVAVDEGSILICCEVCGYVGPALQRLASADLENEFEDHGFEQDFDDEDEEEAARPTSPKEMARYSDDLLLASALRWASERYRIYLYSGLDEDEVANIGLIHVSSLAEIANLCRRHSSYMILPDAQNIHAQLRANTPTS